MNVKFETTNHVLTVPGSDMIIAGNSVYVPAKGGHNVYEHVDYKPGEVTVGKFLRFERKYQ